MKYFFDAGNLETGNERLLQLATFLEEKVRDEHFDYTHYSHNEGGVANFDDLLLDIATEHSCKTTACAMGWVGVCFKDLGLKYRKQDMHILDPTESTHDFYYTLEFEKVGVYLFWLTVAEYDWLFIPHSREEGGCAGDATRLQVAQHIRAVVEQRRKLGFLMPLDFPSAFVNSEDLISQSLPPWEARTFQNLGIDPVVWGEKVKARAIETYGLEDVKYDLRYNLTKWNASLRGIGGADAKCVSLDGLE